MSKLRLAVLVGSRTVPAWQRQLVRDARRYADVELRVVPTASRPVRLDVAGWLWRSHLALDRLRHPARPDALRPVTLDPPAIAPRGAPLAGPFDVVLDLRRDPAPADAGLRPPYGVWQVRVCGGTDAGTAAFRALESGTGVVTTSLDVSGAHGHDGGSAVTWSTWIDRDSAYQTLSRSFWNGHHLVLRQLRLLDAGFAGGEGSSVSSIQSRGRPSAPRAIEVLRHGFRTTLGLLSRRMRPGSHRSDWNIAVRKKRWQILAERDGDGFRPLDAPPGHFHADPFLLARGQVTYLFFEDYSYRDGRGVIGCRALAPDGLAGPPETILASAKHLSYPFVFELDGAVYLIPETTANRTIELYRCLEYPRVWRLERLLMEDVHAADATLFAHDGTLWLFASLADPGTSDWDTLCLFYSDSLMGEWTAHPANPVIRDARSARPAGRLFRDGGRLIRPAQDCSAGYGHAITLNRVDVLTKTAYAETPVMRISPDRHRGELGTHTIDHTDELEVVDARHTRARGRTGGFRPSRTAP